MEAVQARCVHAVLGIKNVEYTYSLLIYLRSPLQIVNKYNAFNSVKADDRL